MIEEWRSEDQLCEMPGSAQDTGRQHDDRFYQSQNALYGNAYEPEREKQKPDDRIENHCQQSKRPAQYQQDQP
jgi:hypothetical protein